MQTTTHTLIIDVATDDTATAWQPIHTEAIDAAHSNDAEARDWIEEYAASAGEYGIFRMRVTDAGDNDTFTSTSVEILADEA